MKKITAIVLSVLTLLAAAAGCGSKSADSAGSYAGGPAYDYDDGVYYAAAPEEAYYDGYVYDDYAYDYGDYEYETAPLSAGAQSGSEIPPERNGVKMIYTAYVEMESTDFDDAVQGIASLVESCGGYFESSSLSDRGSSRSADYSVRVPADQYRAFLQSAGSLCHVTYQQETSEDVSETYYDTAGRLETQRTKLSRLQQLLAEANHMEDIIVIENEISETEEMIDRLSGTLRRYDALVSYSTVNITLREVKVLTEVPEVTETFGSRMGAAFRSGLRSIGNALEDLAVALAYSWLWLLLIAAVVVIVLFATKKKRAALREKREQRKNAPPVTVSVPGYSRPEPREEKTE